MDVGTSRNALSSRAMDLQAIWIRLQSGTTRGLPEVMLGHREQRLVTSGIRSHIRHPVYLDIFARCWPGASVRDWRSAMC